eukprot:3749695-Rhodomonas_salina.5
MDLPYSSLSSPNPSCSQQHGSSMSQLAISLSLCSLLSRSRDNIHHSSYTVQPALNLNSTVLELPLHSSTADDANTNVEQSARAAPGRM